MPARWYLWESTSPHNLDPHEGIFADPAIQTDAAYHFFDVSSDALTQASDFVDESSFCRQKGVGGVLDHFGTFQIGGQDRKLPRVKRTVYLGYGLGRTAIFDADNDPVKAYESPIAAPSRRNSGFEATSNFTCGLVAATMSRILRLVPTGTVDLVNTTVYP